MKYFLVFFAALVVTFGPLDVRLVSAVACSGKAIILGKEQGDVLYGSCKDKCDIQLSEYDANDPACSGDTAVCCVAFGNEPEAAPSLPTCADAAKKQFGSDASADCYSDEKECKDRGLTPFQGGACQGVCCYSIKKTAAPKGGSPGSPVTLTNPLGAGTTLIAVVQRVITAFLGMVGALALGVFVYAGVRWMTASSTESVQKAKDTIKYAVIGLFMIAFSYAIASFLVDALGGSGVAELKKASKEAAEEQKAATPQEANP